MKKNLWRLGAFLSLMVLLTACPKDPIEPPQPPPPPTDTKTQVINQFIYDGMSTYYYWADEMVNKKPNATTSPFEYFKSVLSPLDKEHGWSWITDDVDALLAGFSGEPLDFGYELIFMWYDKAQTRIIAVVKYVYPNTPAAKAGIKRGDIITHIDGAYLNSSTYRKLVGTNPITITVTDSNLQNNKDLTVTPTKISTNPVLHKNVFDIDGHKIGYLFYSAFIANFNQDLYNAFAYFKSEGVTDLILDLRYNHGGGINAATYLASMIAPATAVSAKADFVVMDYNSQLNNYYDSRGWSRRYKLGSFASTEPDPLTANLNLNRVYIIATDDSYSASELTIFNLRPHMNVYHVGDTTGGKFTASTTLHAFDDEKGIPIYESLSEANKTTLANWAMQPIIAIYKDKNNADFSKPGALYPQFPVKTLEYSPQLWKPIGDSTDYLVAKAIEQITGKPVTAYQKSGFRSFGEFEARSLTRKDLLKQSVQVPAKDIPEGIRNELKRAFSTE